MLGEESMRAMKLPMNLERFKTGRGETISNVETIWIETLFCREDCRTLAKFVCPAIGIVL